MKIVIINYGAGNIQSIMFAIERLGFKAVLSNNWDEIKSADKVVFPGVGEASYAMKMLKESAKFEVVIAADVLEHLYNPLATLKAMKGLLDDNGCIVVSLPHAGHSVIQACLFDEDFEYRDVGLLDRTHIRFFGIKNIQKLFEDADMKIIHAEFVVRNPENTEFAERWANTPQALRNVLEKNPFGSVYQVVVKAVSNKTEGEGIIMMNMLVPPQNIALADQARAFLRARVSAKAYSTLRGIYVSARKLLGKD